MNHLLYFFITFNFCGHQNHRFQACLFCKHTIVGHHKYELHAKFPLKTFHRFRIKCDFMKPCCARNPNLTPKWSRLGENSAKIHVI